MYLIWRSNYFSAGSPAPCLSHLCLHSNSCQGGPWDGKRLKQNTFYKNHTNSGTVCEMKTECQRVNNIKNQVYAQKLVGAHKKLQQADSEPFQVKLFVRFKHQEFHGWNGTNQTPFRLLQLIQPWGVPGNIYHRIFSVNLINQSRRFNSSLECRAVGLVQQSKFPWWWWCWCW